MAVRTARARRPASPSPGAPGLVVAACSAFLSRHSGRRAVPTRLPSPARRRVRNATSTRSTSEGDSTRGNVRGVRTSRTPTRRRRPARRAASPRGTGSPLPRVATREQILEQARHARQPPGDRARRQPRLAVLDPHHALAEPRRALRSQEREHVSGSYLRGLLGDDLEEHLQVIRDRQPRVRCTARPDELQIAVHQRMPHRDRDKLRFPQAGDSRLSADSTQLLPHREAAVHRPGGHAQRFREEP
jgi:hypothetical protein